MQHAVLDERVEERFGGSHKTARGTIVCRGRLATEAGLPSLPPAWVTRFGYQRSALFERLISSCAHRRSNRLRIWITSGQPSAEAIRSPLGDDPTGIPVRRAFPAACPCP